ncbi:MAG: hypothetical protein WC828_09330 [Thermoleophilia bacterium]|jgi:hypothetical protein
MPGPLKNFLPFLVLLFLAVLPAVSGCGSPANVSWATPSDSESARTDSGDIKTAMDTYARALVDKNQEEFLSVIDAGNPSYKEQQREMFSRLQAVPFSDYKIEISSQSETAPGTVVVKTSIASTLQGSFTELPSGEKAAFLLVKKDDGWKISGDATEQAFGRKKNAGLEDFGPVAVLPGDHVIVLYHPSQEATAVTARSKAEAAFPQLEKTLPRTELPKVPIRIYDDKQQIDLAYPGQWQDWAGGAARSLGSNAAQGGEIIINSGIYNGTGSESAGYNSTMLSHELTHVALFPQQGARTPPFLIEGLADYVAGIQPMSLLREKLRAGGSFSPQLSDLYEPGGFSALLSTEAATIAYEESDTAVVYLEERFGNEKVLALLREFKRRENDSGNQDRLVDEVFSSQLGISWGDFERDWRRYVTGSGQ